MGHDWVIRYPGTVLFIEDVLLHCSDSIESKFGQA